jgi:hypothetical protein
MPLCSRDSAMLVLISFTVEAELTPLRTIAFARFRTNQLTTRISKASSAYLQ